MRSSGRAALVGPGFARGYGFGTDAVLCWLCAVDRGGSYDSEQERWVSPPRVEALARTPLDSRLVTIYTAEGEGGVLGHALIDVHRVRSMAEGLLVVLAPGGKIRNLRLLAFHEPAEYAPSPRWLEQFGGQSLSDRLRVGGDIHAIAGSTLTSRAVTQAARRAAALYEVLLRIDTPDTGG